MTTEFDSMVIDSLKTKSLDELIKAAETINKGLPDSPEGRKLAQGRKAILEEAIHNAKKRESNWMIGIDRKSVV